MTDNIQKEGMLKVGTLLANGKYRIDQYLASGGFGNTYMATDTAFDEKVAIKELYIKGVCGRETDSAEISISLTENKRAFAAQQEKFRKEARRLRKLSNAHIVKVHDLFDENGTSYYVMDFIEGESLSARQKRLKKPMSEAELMLIVPQVLDALECVHNEGIWHLDLKPANIMIDAKGNVQLIDFGASKQLKNANGESLSTSSVLAYTPGYASSEQIEQNIDKFGPWTDLYSLGATMYNLLTLQQPPTPSDIDEDSREALKLPQGISKKTERLVVWLMKPSRKMRPQQVADVRQFLIETPEGLAGRGWQSYTSDSGDETIRRESQVKPHPTPPAPSPSRKRKRIFVAGAVAVFCVIVGIVVFTPDEEREQSVTDQKVQVTEGPENMRTYVYSGDFSENMPNGQGVAEFDAYDDIPASTYKGSFVDGVCEDESGEAILDFSNGDKYQGTFVGGYYGKGTYTLADGSYYRGTFQESNPYNGKWYNADGTLSAKVVNGVEK